MKKSKASKVAVVGLVIVCLLILSIFGKNEELSLIVLVNKYQVQDPSQSTLEQKAYFCFDLVGNEVLLHPGCKKLAKPLKLCGLQNESEGKWNSSFLNYDSKVVSRTIASSLKEFGCEQIIIDFEEVKTPNEDANLWIYQLSKYLKNSDVVVHFAAYAKTDSKGLHASAGQQSYEEICAHFDEIWIMSYDYSIPPYTSEGELAPLDWVEKVATYAKTKCDTNQIRMGLAAYGYNWSDHSVIFEKNYDPAKQTYNSSIETVIKRRRKISLLRQLHIKKVFIWADGMFKKPI